MHDQTEHTSTFGNPDPTEVASTFSRKQIEMKSKSEAAEARKSEPLDFMRFVYFFAKKVKEKVRDFTLYHQSNTRVLCVNV